MGYVSSLFDLKLHAEALATLWRENMSDRNIAQLVKDRLEWLYEKSPLGPTVTWLATDEATKEVVGCASLYPHDVSIDGTLHRAAIGMDFAVAKKHRVGGPAIILQRAVLRNHRKHGFLFTYTYPNVGSLAVVKRVGFTEIAEASHWVKPVRSGYKLAAYVRSKPALGVASFVLDRALGFADRRHLVVNARKFRGELMDAADSRMDDLWERARGRYVIVGDKSSAYLNWRYTGCKTTRYAYFALFERKSERLVGFIVFSVADNKAFIADLFCEDLENTLSHLLVRFASKMRRAGRDSIFVAYAGGEAFRRRLKGLDFIQREFSRHVVAAVANDIPEPLKKKILDPESWILFDGELDL